MIWIAVVAVLVVLLGLAGSIVVRRRAGNREQAARNWRVVNAFCLLLVAALVLFIGITNEHRRYLNFAISPAMALIAIWQLRSLRRDAAKPQRPEGI